MTPPRGYSSLAAFLAHWRALSAGDLALNPAEHAMLSRMDEVADGLSAAERLTLAAESVVRDDHAAAHRRERAERNLRHLLLGAGWLQS